jgi:hypothetical protein
MPESRRSWRKIIGQCIASALLLAKGAMGVPHLIIYRSPRRFAWQEP